MHSGGELTLVIGGARSGKSEYAESLIRRHDPPWYYIATAEALDTEMAARIAGHRGRRGSQWQTVEAPLELGAAITRIPEGAPVLVDCLTLWLSNQLLAGGDPDIERERLMEVLRMRNLACYVVTNEVGLGIVPDNAIARRFRDEAGRLNRLVAAIADQVIWMVAGIPVRVK